MAYYGRASFNRGDYYRGDYYRGDPGFFGSLLHAVGGVVGGAVKGLLGGGPIGGIVGAVKGGITATKSNMAGEVSSAPLNVHAQQVAMHQAALQKLAAGHPAGGAVGRRRRAINPTNVKALRRALRRAEGFHSLAKRVLRVTHPKAHVAPGFKTRFKKRRAA
jgi:hypothetical protein